MYYTRSLSETQSGRLYTKSLIVKLFRSCKRIYQLLNFSRIIKLQIKKSAIN